MVAPTPPASSRTDAIRPSTSTRPRPVDSTLRRTTVPSGSPPRTNSRPSTSRPSAPSRMAPASARSPISSLREDSSADLPVPVSPVSTVSPAAGLMVASSMSATFLTRSSSIMC